MQAYASTANLPQQATKEKFFIEPLPYMKPVQIVIVVFSVVTLSLAAAWLSYINSYFDGGYSKLILYYDYKPMPYSLFCAIFSLVGITYILVAENANRGLYNVWAVLALEFVLTVFWLASMGSVAAIGPIDFEDGVAVDNGLRLGIIMTSTINFVAYAAISIGMIVTAVRMGAFYFGSGNANQTLPQYQQGAINHSGVQMAPQQVSLGVDSQTTSPVPAVQNVNQNMHSPFTAPVPQIINAKSQ